MRRYHLFLTAFLAIALSGCSYDVVVIDSDGDGVPNDKDGCPYDKLKTEPGMCGCGYREAHSETGNLICQSLGLVDSDGDTVPDIYDECPKNPTLHAKDEKCGCDTDGKVDIATQARVCQTYVDSDGDGVVDDLDGCPYDNSKTEPGECGCGQIDYRENVEQETLLTCMANIDSDSDTVPDVYDECPYNPFKKVKGKCGCDKPEEASCGTSFENRCPGNEIKLEPGLCGCDMLEIDQCPRNGVPDCMDVLDSHLMANPPACFDRCPDDDEKTEPGFCGCGVKDIDTDNDGNVDYCLTGDEPCATVDSDGDGTLDCWDQCPFDDKKIEPGFCGCGVKEIDKDGDGNVDYCLTGNEQCPTVDSDGDGVLDCWDKCPLNKDIQFDDADCDGTPDTEDACPHNPDITSEDQKYKTQASDTKDYSCQYYDATQTFTVGTGEDILLLRAFLKDWGRTFEISAEEDEGSRAPMPRDNPPKRLTIRLIDNIQIHISEAQVLEYDEWGENPTLRPSWLPLPPVLNADIVGGFIHKAKGDEYTPIRITVTDGQKRVPLAGPLFERLEHTSVSNLILDYDVKGMCPAGFAKEIVSSELTNLTFSGSLEFSQDMQENDEYCGCVGGIAASLLNNEKNEVQIIDTLCDHAKLNFISPAMDLSDGLSIGCIAGRVERGNGNIVYKFNPDKKNTIDELKHSGMGSIGGLFGEVDANLTLENINNEIQSISCSGQCGGMIGALYNSRLTATHVSNVIHKMTCDASPDSYQICGGAFGSIAFYIESDDSGVVKINHLENRIDDLEASGMSGGFVGTLHAYMWDAADTPIGDAVDTPIAIFEHIFSEVSAFKAKTNDELLGDDKSSIGLLFGELSAYAYDSEVDFLSAFKLSNIFTIGQTPYLLGNNLKESSVLDVNYVYYYGVDHVFASNPDLPVRDGGDIPAFIKFEPGKIADVVSDLNGSATPEIWTSKEIEFGKNKDKMSIPVFKDSAIFDAAQE